MSFISIEIYNKYYKWLTFNNFSLKEKKLTVPVVNIKDTRLLQKYVHIYNVSVTQNMIIKHNFEFEN